MSLCFFLFYEMLGERFLGSLSRLWDSTQYQNMHMIAELEIFVYNVKRNICLGPDTSSVVTNSSHIAFF